MQLGNAFSNLLSPVSVYVIEIQFMFPKLGLYIIIINNNIIK